MRRHPLLAAIVLMTLQVRTLAVGTLIPAESRTDMAYDQVRDVLYITGGDMVLRYQVWSDTFLSPLALGGDLKGIDLSADGRTLVVADLSRNLTQDWFHIVNVDSGSQRKAFFQLGTGEVGTFSLAIGWDASVVVASAHVGTGELPLRRVNLITGTATELATISSFAIVAGSFDQSYIGFAEGNISDGRFGRYRVADGSLLRKEGYTEGTSWSNYEITVNRDGTQYALPTYGGTFIYDSGLTKIGTIGVYAGPQPIGVAFHPFENIIYLAWAGTREVRAYETVGFTQVGSFDFEQLFVNTGVPFSQGRLKVSRDGSLLFAAVNGGVRYVRLLPPQITDASRDGRNIVVQGVHFDSRAAILVDGTPWKTVHDENVGNTLTARKLWKAIAPGQTVRIQVSNPDSMVSEEFSFTRSAG